MTCFSGQSKGWTATDLWNRLHSSLACMSWAYDSYRIAVRGLQGRSMHPFIRLSWFVAIVVLLTACADAPPPVNWTSQPVERIAALGRGMSQRQVTNVMGEPARREFSGEREAWHYCRTGIGADEFAVVLFSRGVVEAAKNYNVTVAQTGGATGDCSKFVRSIF